MKAVDAIQVVFFGIRRKENDLNRFCQGLQLDWFHADISGRLVAMHW